MLTIQVQAGNQYLHHNLLRKDQGESCQQEGHHFPSSTRCPQMVDERSNQYWDLPMHLPRTQALPLCLSCRDIVGGEVYVKREVRGTYQTEKANKACLIDIHTSESIASHPHIENHHHNLHDTPAKDSEEHHYH